MINFNKGHKEFFSSMISEKKRLFLALSKSEYKTIKYKSPNILLMYLAMKLKPKYGASEINGNNNTETNYYGELWTSHSLKNFILCNYLLNCWKIIWKKVCIF